MASNGHQRDDSFPKGLIHLILIGGLAALTCAILTQELLVFAALACVPLALIFCYYGISHPRFSYLVYITFMFYMTAIMRYSRQGGLSVIGNILLVCIAVFILIYCIYKEEDLRFSQAFSFLTVG